MRQVLGGWKGRHAARARALAVYLAVKRFGLRQSEVASALGLSRGGVCRAAGRGEGIARDLRHRLDSLIGRDAELK
jgi:hypothetical protein